MAKEAGAASRQEQFRRATAATLRAVAREPEVEVTYQPGNPGLSGNKARLPLPTRELGGEEVGRIRGECDGMALRLRHHDRELHARRAPNNPQAREVFDSLERVRIEALGCRNRDGVAANLGEALKQRCELDGYDQATAREQVPHGGGPGLADARDARPRLALEQIRAEHCGATRTERGGGGRA